MPIARLLIADDEDSIHEFVSNALEKEDFRVDHVSNGHEALRLASHEPYDLIISDLVMPMKDGLSFIQLMRSQEYKMPIVVMSGYVTDDVRRELGYLKDITILPKPVRPDELRKVIRKLVGATA